ncbi:amino acid permease-domain-containing protein [Aspergillus leporis]|uniref:Amino acid permease-domain-containing protein n=1 Tax=Aspergillus leporis TaxID=41062 RepID=A0A5N5WT00_9EURO|nr:amino acid permease-domain-containing protein [Aspergillus leporis]
MVVQESPETLKILQKTLDIELYGVIAATNEIKTYLPVGGLGFAMGWLYWYSFGILVAHGITAAALVIDYWPKSVQVAVWITIMFVVVIDLNFFPVKVFMIIGLLILSFILFWVGGPDNQRLGFHDRKDLGAMNAYLMTGNTGRFCAYLYVLCYPVFSFNFTPELLALPMAAKRYFYRLIIFYIGDILAIGVICPSNADGLMNGSGIAVSPWVIAIKRAGIHGLDSVTNAVIITSAWLSGNSYLYMSSKSFFSLAAAGNTPAIFTRCNRWGVPHVVFNWFINLTNTAGFISWMCCCVVFHRFRKACNMQSISKPSITYQSKLQSYLGCLQPSFYRYCCCVMGSKCSS